VTVTVVTVGNDGNAATGNTREDSGVSGGDSGPNVLPKAVFTRQSVRPKPARGSRERSGGQSGGANLARTVVPSTSHDK
jgi:hypothetical protein